MLKQDANFTIHVDPAGPRLEKNMEAYMGAYKTRSMEGRSSKFKSLILLHLSIKKIKDRKYAENSSAHVALRSKSTCAT